MKINSITLSRWFASLAVLAAVLCLGPSAKAATTGFNQTAAGPWDYNTVGNWVSSTINGTWDTSLTLAAGQTVTFATPTTLSTSLNFNYAGNFALALKASAAGTQTITLGGDIGLATSGGTTANVTIGDSANHLNVNLGAAIRTITVPASRTLTLADVVSNGSITKAGLGTLTLSGANTFATALKINDNGGIVAVTSASGLGTAPITIGSSAGNSVTGEIQLSGGLNFTAGAIGFAQSRLSIAAGGAPNIENLSGNNSLNSAMSINGGGGSGANILSTAGTLTLSGNLTVASGNRPYIFYGAGNTTVSGNIVQGTGTLVQKEGSGTLTIIGTGNTYAGATTVNGGTLLVNSPGSLPSGSAVTVAGGATLGGSGTINGTVNLIAGAILSPGSASATIGTLTLANNTATSLTLNGSTLFFDLPNTGTTCDLIAITGASGALVLNGANTIFLNAPNGAVPAGTYTLMTYSAKTGSGTLTFPNGSTTLGNATLTVGATSVTLTVGAGGLNFGLDTWKGSVSGVWDGGALNWTRNATASSAYTAGDAVTFDDTGSAAATISSGSTVSPASVLFNNSVNAYTVSAVIGGSTTALLKIGGATSTLSGANTYSGGTTISAGTLALSGSGTLGSTTGALTLSGGTLDLGALTTPTVGAVSITAAPSSGNTIQNGTLTGTSYAASLTTGTATISAILAGSGIALTKSGAGTLTLSSATANTYSGGTTESAGTLILTGTQNLGTGTVAVNGGTLQLGNNSSANGSLISANTVTLASGTSLNLAAPQSSSLTYAGFQINASGNASLNCVGQNIQTATLPGAIVLNNTSGSQTFTIGESSAANTLSLQGIISGTGDLTVSPGGTANNAFTVKLNQGWGYAGNTAIKSNGGDKTILQLLAGGTLPSATVLTINANATAGNTATFDLNGQAQTLAGLTSAGTAASDLIGGSVAGSALTVSNASTAYTFNGVISGVTSLTKTGAGTLNLGGANTYTGGTTVSAGTLLVNTPGSLASGSAVTVASAATLGGNGTINGTVNVSSGGYLAPGGVAAYGTLTLAKNTASSLTLNGNLLRFDLNTAATAGTTYDQIAISGGSGALVLNGANILQLNAPSGPIQAGTYTLMTYAAKTGSGTLTLPNGALTMGNFALTVGATSVTLVVSANTTYSALAWTGSASASWDGAALNWLNGVTASTFSAGNAVTFDDNGSGASTITSSATVSPGSVVFNNNATNYTISATLGSGGIVKNGSASATLSGNNTYSDSVAVNGGTLALSGGTLSGVTGVTVASGAVLQPNAFTTYTSIPTTITGNGAGGLGALFFNNGGGGTATWPGAVTLGSGGATIGSFGTAYTTILTGGIGGTGPLTFNGRGGSTSAHTANFTLNTTACSYSGDTTINNNDGVKEATLTIGLNNALPTTTALNLGIVNNVSTVGVTFDLNGKNQQLAGLAKNSTGTSTKYRVLNNSATTSTLTISNASTAYSYDGLIGIASNDKLNLVKQGAATLTLGGANLYAGNTTISGGTLALSSSGSIAKTPQIAITSGATFNVSANTSGFTFTGSSPVQTLAASSSTGTATISAGTGAAGVTVASGALLSFQADGTGSTVGKISVTGDLNLNTNAITVNVSGAALAAGDYPLMSCSGTLANTGTFGTPTITGTPLSGTIPSIVVTPGALGTIVLRIANPAAVDTSIALSRTAGGSPSIYGDTLTFHAVLTANDSSIIPDGQTITFLTNGVAIGTSLTSGGAADLTTNTFPYSGGSAFPVTATFAGISGYNSCLGTLSGGQQVNKYTLTLSGATAQNKLFDGGTAAVITGGTLSSTLFSDVVTATNGTFASAAAGSGISVTVSLSGSAAANYTLTQPGLTATIFANPTWTNTASGYWDTNANWISSTVASGSGVTADFSKINPTADVTVSLKSPRTIGNMIFGDTDTTSTAGWTVDNNSTAANNITLAGGTPTITVNTLGTDKTATISASITGSANLTKAGTGTLVLAGPTTLGSSFLNVNAGKLVLTNGGAVGVGSSTAQGVAGGASLEINGGSLTTSTYLTVGTSAGTSTFTLNSGGFTNNGEFLICYPGMAGTAGTVNLNGGVADLNNFSMASGAGSSSTMNLNSGGTVRLNFFHARNAAATANINFNGATVVAKTAQSDFIQTGTLLTANVQTGGAIFDSNGNNITDNAPLQHDPALGATPDGGLTKFGAGTLTLTATNTYTGNTTISNGTLTIFGAGQLGSGTYAGNITNNAAFNYASTAAQTFSGIISGPGSLTNSGTGTLTLSGVNTYTGNTTISAGKLVVNGSLAGMVTVKSGTTLGGNGGTIAGAVMVMTGGLLAPGDNGFGTLTLASVPTLGGTLLMKLNKTGATNDVVKLTSGGFSYGGTLTLTNTAGTLSGGEVFDLFDFIGTSGGSFTTITTSPALASGLNWYLGNLSANGTIVLNRAPVASDILMGAISGTPVTLQIIDGKYSPNDADGNMLMVSMVQNPSANGGTVTTDGTNVTYTAAGNFTGTDTFTYTVSDGFGGMATNLITATVAANGAGFNLLSGPVNHGDGTATINYAGIPGYHYALETTPDLTTLPILWTALVTNTASTANGQLSFTFSTASGQGFFRTRYIP